MRTLAEVLAQISEVPDYAGVRVDSVESVTPSGDRPLHIAAVWGDCEAIQLLVKSGANVNELGECKFTPLMYAVEHQHRAAIEMLVELGADSTRNEIGCKPSEYAGLAHDGQDLATWLSERNL